MAVFDSSADEAPAPASAVEARRDPVVAPGEILGGRYRIERLVGEGGMGQVLAATHLGLGQEVAIKIMHVAKASDGESVQRFLREARAAVMLKSSHVARVFDVATTDAGLPYIVMELLEGKDLVTVLIESGALPYVDAADVILQVCDAVAEAHALGIIHRDLKPENFFLSRRRDGAPDVKVLDFGISKLGSESASHKGRRIVTQENTVLGSPTYMAPEQVRNSKRVDERSDIWSLGVSLYELLTAGEPFGADSIPEIFVNVLTTSPTPPDQVIADIPPAMSAIVMRCLEKDPAARFQSVGELASALAPFGSGKPVSVAPTWNDGERSPDSSSSLIRRLSAPTPPPFKPMMIISTPAAFPLVPSSPAPISLSATIAERPAAKSHRGLVAGLLIAAAAMVLVAGGGVVSWKLRHARQLAIATGAAAAAPIAPPSADVPAVVAAEPPAAPAAPASPEPADGPLPVSAASAASASNAATTASAATRNGKPAPPRGVSGPRAGQPPATSPKTNGLPRERTSW